METKAKFNNVSEIIEGSKLTKKEVALISLLNELLSGNFGEGFSDIDCEELAKALDWPVKSVVGVVGSLVKKGICETWDTGTGFDVVSFVGQAGMDYVELTHEETKVAAEPKKATKAKTVRKVGDIHKNGKWVWTEYKAGKFDWRVAKAGSKPAAPAKAVEVEVEEPVAEVEGTFTSGSETYEMSNEILALPEEVRQKAIETVKSSYSTKGLIDIANEASGSITIEQFMKENKVTKTKEASRKRFLKDTDGGYYSKENLITEGQITMLVEALGDNFGLYNYFNKQGSPISIKATDVGSITKQIKSRNISDMMAATQYRVTKVEIEMWKHNGSSLLEIYIIKNATLSMQEINSFM